MEKVFSLTPMQQGMLFHRLREPDSAAYFQQLQVHLAGELHIELLQAAWNQVLQRHCALQMHFEWNGDTPRQVLDSVQHVPFFVVDFRENTDQSQDALRRDFLQKDRQQGCALDSAPLMRVTILQWAERQWDLIWSHHHLILDGWSSGLVLNEVQQIYAALLDGNAPALKPERPYTDFLRWLSQRDNLADEDYWRHTMQGVEQATALPLLHRGKPAANDDVANVVSFQCQLDVQSQTALNRMTQELGVTAAIPVFACWGWLLSRYADTDDVVFGITTSGRPADFLDVENMVGLFINTIPLRMKAGRAMTIGECLIGLHKRLASSREHEHTGLSRIAAWSNLPSGQSLFDSIVVVENYPLAARGDTLGNAKIVDFHLQEESNYPLTLIVEPCEAGLELRLLADTNRVASHIAQAMAEQMCFLLQQLAKSGPMENLCQLQLLTPAQQHQQLHVWNDTHAPYDTGASLASLFIDQVKRTPDATALIDANGELSYLALQDRVSQLVQSIDQLKLNANSPIAVRMTRDREMLIALLAVVSAGHHYVPIEPQLPAARVMAIFDSLPVACLLTVTSLLESTRLLVSERSIEVIDTVQTQVLPVCELHCRANPRDPAYVIFTSGSTGRPKGVLVLHQKVVNLVSWVNSKFKINADDTILFVTSPAFDLSVYDIFGILAAGACVRIANEAEISDPERLLHIIEHEPITFWDSAPAALWQLESLLPRCSGRAKLRLVFLSGDWIPLALPDKLKAAFTDVCVVALGGATEATIWSNYYIVQQVQSEWVSIPYGRPIQNARYYILDSALQAVPVGVAGDLYIGGDCLAEGYVGEPQLTAERFIPDPYAPPGTQGARMYRTGDRAKFFPDGVMEFLGRLDNQVKIRGFRVELGDIEVAMNRHPAIKDAICIVYDPSTSGPASGQSDKELIGYFVLQHGENLSTEAYQQYLAKNLPVNMLPSFLIRLDSLPVSVNGKVDRKNLPLPERKNARNFSVHSNKDALQDIVAAAWCEVLGIEHVHSGDDFFSLGGHSLRATSVMARLRVAIGIDLPLRLIFEHTTLHALSAAIRNLATGDANGQELSLPIVDRTQGVRLSRAQSRLYFLHQLERDSANYNVALAAKLTGDVDLNAFSLAAQQVVSRHEIFNLRISHSGELAMLVPVDTDIASVLNIDDLRHLYLDETQILCRIKELACLPFDLEQQRPLRINLLRTDDQQVFVLIVMHHIATDGWSIALFAEELLAAYDAVRQPLPAIPDMVPALQYADFSAWHEQLVEEKYQEPEMLYWKQQLPNLPRLHLPTDFPRQATSLHAGARISFVLDEQLSVVLRRVARQQSVTLFMLMLTAFEVVLRHRSGQDEIVVGTDIAGRDHPLAEKIQGFFVNQLVLRTHYSACVSFSDMLEQVRQSCLQAYFHQHLPFDALVQELNPSRDAGGMPLFQHKFVLQNAPLAQMQSQHFSIHPIDLHTDTAKYDLLLTVLDESPMRATLEFSTELFTQATAENMVREFSDVLKQVAADCSVSYASLSAMLDTEGEARQNLARRDLRKSGLQRLKELRKPGTANV